jgi:glycosyltransferase involved in cell wall biosynthesis
MNEHPITIGITCYNEGEWLLECWESILAQDDDRWEAVLVMDGTTHTETIKVFESLMHPKLRKERMPVNRGPYPTRNRAVELTGSPYHYYVDGDDKLPANAVRTVLDAFSKNPDASFVYGDVMKFGEESGVWKFQPFNIDDLVRCQCIMGPSPFRVELWRALGGYAEELARGNGDYDFWLGALEAGFHGVYVPEVIYHYRIRESGNVSKSYDLSYYRTHEIIAERHRKIFADQERKHRFLYRGYSYSARSHYGVGNFGEARALALKARGLGFGQEEDIRKILFYTRLPGLLLSLKRTIGLYGRKLLTALHP